MRHTRPFTRLMRWTCLLALLLAACGTPAAPEPTEVALRPAGLSDSSGGGEASLQLSLAVDPAGATEPALPRHFGLTMLGADGAGQLAFEEAPAYPPSGEGVPPDNPLAPLPLGLPAGLTLDYRSAGPRGYVPVLSPDCPFVDTLTAAGTAHTCALTWVYVEGGPHADEPVVASEHALLRVVTRVENAGAPQPLAPGAFPALLARRDGSQAALPGGVAYTPGADPCATGQSQCFNPSHSPTLSFSVVTVDLYRAVAGTTDRLDLDYAMTADAAHPDYTASYEGDCGRDGLARATPGRLLTCTLTHTFTGGGETSLQLSLAVDPAGSREPALPRQFGLAVLGSDHGQLTFEEQPAYSPSGEGVPTDNPLAPLPLGLPAGLTLDYRSAGPRGHVPVLSPDCPFAGTTSTVAGTAHTCALTWVYVEGGPHADEPVAAGEHALLRVVTRVENAGAPQPLAPGAFPALLARRDGSQAALPGGVAYTPGADPCATGLTQCFNPSHSPTLSFSVVTVDLYRAVSGTTDRLDLDYAVVADAAHPEYTTSYEGDCGREGLARATPGRLLTCTLTHTFTGGGAASAPTSTPVPSPTPLPPTATPVPATATPTRTPTPATVALRTLAVSATSVKSGGTVTVTVTLSGPAPKGGAVVALKTSNAAALPVPPSVTVPAGATGTRFSLTAGKVAANTAVTLLGAYNGAKAEARLTVTP